MGICVMDWWTIVKYRDLVWRHDVWPLWWMDLRYKSNPSRLKRMKWHAESYPILSSPCLVSFPTSTGSTVLMLERMSTSTSAPRSRSSSSWISTSWEIWEGVWLWKELWGTTISHSSTCGIRHKAASYTVCQQLWKEKLKQKKHPLSQSW